MDHLASAASWALRMITEQHYFANPRTGELKPHSLEQAEAARDLLHCVNNMLVELGWHFPINANTGTPISGAKGGNGDGGFRLEDSGTGGAHSSHKILFVQEPDGTWRHDPENAKAGIDIYDPENWLDDRITDELLERHGLYREHPDETDTWLHATTRAPFSGKRTFWP